MISNYLEWPRELADLLEKHCFPYPDSVDKTQEPWIPRWELDPSRDARLEIRNLRCIITTGTNPPNWWKPEDARWFLQEQGR